MGTLGDQLPRKDRFISSEELSGYLDDIKSLAKNKGLEVETVIKAAEVLELKRRNDLYVSNGDYFDEQMGGFGAILRSIADSLQK
ncbi:hypothetical protein [Leptospira yasudae]|uniref:Uncharacterized protein n=1 Tax=Leptospira yasudae TaxID=2202201 RepID=A0ABX9LX51_9LEPT|nr:hypothetical protein [Leptospira yasudae]RHX77426.1 hypothetical protein DLM77_21220 [Leptospira yasudae]